MRHQHPLQLPCMFKQNPRTVINGARKIARSEESADPGFHWGVLAIKGFTAELYDISVTML
jgi:hypothetical protein